MPAMQVLVCYDVTTTSPEGRRRLQRVARVCLDFGQRVQQSVFECTVDDTALTGDDDAHEQGPLDSGFVQNGIATILQEGPTRCELGWADAGPHRRTASSA